MTKADPIMERDIAIGQYTLGLLTPKDNARLQALLGSDAAAARNALRWEETFLTLVDALPPVQPPRQMLDHVLTALDLPLPVNNLTQPSASPQESRKPVQAITSVQKPDDPTPTSTASQKPAITRFPEPADDTNKISHSMARPRVPVTEPKPVRNREDKIKSGKRTFPTVWMGGTALAVVLLALLTLVFMPSEPAEPPVVIVEVAPSKGAILQAPGQSSTPGWVVTVDLENNVTLTPHVHTETPVDASVQLWTYNEGLPQPRSLGLIDPNQPVAVPAQIMGEISEGQFFEMTLEPEGGSPVSEPSGPILFIGRVVTFSQ